MANIDRGAEIYTKILNLCEDNPDAGLEFIETSIINRPEFESSLPVKFARAMAYASKGLLLALRQKRLDIFNADANEIIKELRLTDDQLAYLELALNEIREIEVAHPNFVFVKKIETEDDRLMGIKVDGIATVLEKCRPGSVQQILGKTKLQYFGHHRVKLLKDLEASDVKPYLDIFFTCNHIIRSALVVGTGKDTGELGREGHSFIVVALFEEPNVFNEQGEVNPLADRLFLLDDGTCILR